MSPLIGWTFGRSDSIGSIKDKFAICAEIDRSAPSVSRPAQDAPSASHKLHSASYQQVQNTMFWCRQLA
eukprot:4128024-Heterocapsa_arctica.AAC.1